MWAPQELFWVIPPPYPDILQGTEKDSHGDCLSAHPYALQTREWVRGCAPMVGQHRAISAVAKIPWVKEAILVPSLEWYLGQVPCLPHPIMLLSVTLRFCFPLLLDSDVIYAVHKKMNDS